VLTYRDTLQVFHFSDPDGFLSSCTRQGTSGSALKDSFVSSGSVHWGSTGRSQYLKTVLYLCTEHRQFLRTVLYLTQAVVKDSLVSCTEQRQLLRTVLYVYAQYSGAVPVPPCHSVHSLFQGTSGLVLEGSTSYGKTVLQGSSCEEPWATLSTEEA
jgi:hypothetical protein